MTEEIKKKPGRPKKNPEEVKSVVEENKTVNNGPTYEELLNIVQTLSNEIQTLKSNSNTPQQSSDSTINELLTKLASRRADEEVVLVHNCEIVGGSSTHIDLNGFTIDFRGAGEQRILTFPQFEQLVSEYRSWFDKKIILLGPDHAELAEKYGLPYVEGGSKPLNHNELLSLNKLTVPELENYVLSLGEKDKEIVYSFWVGKCYTKEEGFYDRQKVEMLNRISDNRMENLIAYMNGDYLREKK